MRFSCSICLFYLLHPADAFSVVSSSIRRPSSTRLYADAAPGGNTKKQLGLLTFDLDDTLYPIDVVMSEANDAFVKAMERYGYEGIAASDIDETGKQIRLNELSKDEAAATTHSGIRELAIRRELEKAMLERKLQETADDWATPVSSLADVVVQHAKQWTKKAVSPSIVSAILSAWEMERHHAAERNLYPEVIDVLQQIKMENPGVIIGAVTDGKASPLFMTFTLGPFFDFCVGWEDDQGARQKFFVDLAQSERTAELSWIYEAARFQYATLKDLTDKIAQEMSGSSSSVDPQLSFPATYDDLVYIHVGDDLGYDVGGSAQCGAKTILAELAPKYGQTSRHRFDLGVEQQPAWATSTANELARRRALNDAAQDKVDERVNYLSDLPDAIQRILKEP